jgi:acyl-CoA synthetase (AMP-forming)/AMP-acid ligase II
MNTTPSVAANANAVTLFEAAARRYPALPALIERDRTLTYAELQGEVDATAAWLRARGLGAGDRVLVFVPVSADLYRVLLALLKIGAVAVFIDEWASYARLSRCCEAADCRAFIGTGRTRWLGWLLPALRRVPLHLNAGDYRGCRTAPAGPTAPLAAAAPALITFTTGSTGRPKAANRTHGFLRAQHAALEPYLEPRPGRRALVALPIVVLSYLAGGACVVLADGLTGRPQRPRPERWFERIQQTGATELVASPYWALQLAQHCAGYGLKTKLRRIFTGGAPVYPAQARALLRAFPEADVQIVYGSTEAEPIAVAAATEVAATAPGLYAGAIDHRLQLAILPLNWTAVSAMPAAFGRAQLPPGATGEIVVAGPHVLDAYLGDAGRSKVVVGDIRWHRTGDAGWLDADGKLFLAGRCRQLIRRGDRLISPFAAEARLAEVDGVSMGTVVERAGALIAVVESRLPAPVLEPRIRAALDFAVDRLVVVRALPRDPRHHSKIDYERAARLG